jgi:hypothetical protein
MTIHSFRRLTVVGALALATTAAAACTSAASPVEPSPPSAATPTIASPAPAAPTPTSAQPVPAASPAAGAGSNGGSNGAGSNGAGSNGRACLGPVVHRIDASDTGPPWKRLCMTVGGVLRVSNLGPEGFSADSRDKVECAYEAAVRDCRLLRTGTVRFTITNAHQTRTLTLAIAKASSPAGPAPACMAPRATFTIDATEGGPPGRPVCLKTSATVRVVNLGPDGFRVSPADAVVCTYEAAVRQCRFTGPGTVTFVTTHGDSAPRTQTVVAIR